jgi:hypothetical protein
MGVRNVTENEPEMKTKKKSLVNSTSIRMLFFFIHVGCPGQLTRTTTIPHGPLDILQAQEQVRHHGGNRRAHRGSNPGGEPEQVHDRPQQLNPQMLGTHEGSNQNTQAVQSLPRRLSYKPPVYECFFDHIVAISSPCNFSH